MSLRFDRSLGAFRLVQWNARELALTASLSLLNLKRRIGWTNGLQPDHADPGPRIAIPTVTKSGEGPERGHAPHTCPPGFDRRHVPSIAILVALVLGYVTGQATSSQQATVPAAKAEMAAVNASPPQERMALPVSVLDAVQEASSPVAEASMPRTATAPKRESLPLSGDEVREAQAWLNAFGFSAGPVDGLAGSQTMAAAKRYRSARKMEEGEGLDQSVLQQLRQQSGH